MKTKDKDLLVNPLADVKPPREGPSFVEQKTDSLKKIWSLFKEAFLEGAFGKKSGGYSSSGGWPAAPPRPRPSAPPRPKSKAVVCPLCGTNDCLDRKEMQRLRNKRGSLGNTLLRSCEVRRQLKEMEKFRVRTSSGDDVWMTKQGRIQRPTKPPPPPNPPPIRTTPDKEVSKAFDELAKLKAENVALKILMDDKLAERMRINKAKDDEMKAYHDRKKTSESAKEILEKIRGRNRTRGPIR